MDSLPQSKEEMLALLEGMSDEDLQELYEMEMELEARLSVEGPQTDDELHAWIKQELGIDIPRVAVCEGHDAPFDFVADAFFERVNAILVMGARSSGKTFLVAILHWCNSKFKSGCESCTFGAIEEQSYRAYEHLSKWIFDREGNRRPDVIASMLRKTIFRNGSSVIVLGATPSAVNGPHPQKVHADEVELMREDTFRESRNMSSAGRTADGKLIVPQDIMTSTRKGPSGRMQQLIDEIDEAVREGYEPPRKLYTFCLFEAAKERPECRRADPVERAARLKELNLDPTSLCDCDKIRKGAWDDGRPRTLDEVCDGKFFRSRGHEEPEEVKKHFRENDRNTFEVQQLCLMPEMKFHYFPEFKEAHHVVRNFIPDPENGYIFQSVDWGGSNPHSVHWYQMLSVEVEVDGWTRMPDGTYPKVRMREGTIICFDEIYVAEIGNDKLGKLVLAKEAEWRKIVPGFRVYERFADPQGKAARTDWRDLGLPTKWHTTREFEEHIKIVVDMAGDDLIRVDARCESWIREVKHWRRDEKTLQQIDKDNHAMSDFRYALANIKKIGKKLTRTKALPGSGPQRRSTPRVRVVRENSGPMGYRGKDEFANWRGSLGEPISRRNS